MLPLLLEILFNIEAKRSQKRTRARLWNGARPIFWITLALALVLVWLWSTN